MVAVVAMLGGAVSTRTQHWPDTHAVSKDAPARARYWPDTHTVSKALHRVHLAAWVQHFHSGSLLTRTRHGLIDKHTMPPISAGGGVHDQALIPTPHPQQLKRSEETTDAGSKSTASSSSLVWRLPWISLEDVELNRFLHNQRHSMFNKFEATVRQQQHHHRRHHHQQTEQPPSMEQGGGTATTATSSADSFFLKVGGARAGVGDRGQMLVEWMALFVYQSIGAPELLLKPTRFAVGCKKSTVSRFWMNARGIKSTIPGSLPPVQHWVKKDFPNFPEDALDDVERLRGGLLVGLTIPLLKKPGFSNPQTNIVRTSAPFVDVPRRCAQDALVAHRYKMFTLPTADASFVWVVSVRARARVCVCV